MGANEVLDGLGHVPAKTILTENLEKSVQEALAKINKAGLDALAIEIIYPILLELVKAGANLGKEYLLNKMEEEMTK